MERSLIENPNNLIKLFSGSARRLAADFLEEAKAEIGSRGLIYTSSAGNEEVISICYYQTSGRGFLRNVWNFTYGPMFRPHKKLASIHGRRHPHTNGELTVDIYEPVLVGSIQSLIDQTDLPGIDSIEVRRSSR